MTFGISVTCQVDDRAKCKVPNIGSILDMSIKCQASEMNHGIYSIQHVKCNALHCVLISLEACKHFNNNDKNDNDHKNAMTMIMFNCYYT